MLPIGERVSFSGSPSTKSTICLGKTIPEEQRNANEGSGQPCPVNGDVEACFASGLSVEERVLGYD